MKNDKPTTLILEPEDDTGIIGGAGRSFEPETVKHTETLIIQDGAKGLAMNVFFSRWEALTDIFIPASVMRLYSGTFRGCGDLTVRCHEGSYAHSFFLGLERVEKFKAAVDKLCQEFNVTIAHEDDEGSFEILPYYDSGLANWFRCAHHDDWRHDDWRENRRHPEPRGDKTHKRIELIKEGEE